MPYTDEEIAHAARLAEDFDPAQAEWESTMDLRAIAEAAQAATAGEARLREAVEIARARGRSWNRIGIALGVSRQAARQRFADKVAQG
jgi:hypothetical protein